MQSVSQKMQQYLQPALLVKNVRQPRNTLKTAGLRACWRKSDVVLKIILGAIILAGLKVEQQIVLDRENSIILHPLVIAGVQLCDQRLEALSRDHKVDMCRTERVAVECPEKLASSAVHRQRVGGGLVAVVPVLAILICGKLAAQVVRLLVLRVLEVILAVGTRLPDVDNGVGNTLLGVEVANNAMHESLLAVGVWVGDDRVSKLAEWRVRRPERAKDGARCRCLTRLVDVLVSDFVDQPEMLVFRQQRC